MVELTLNLTSWLLWVPSAYKRPPGGLKVTPRYCCLPGPRPSPFMLFHSLMQTGACKPYCLCEWCPWFVYYTVLSGTAVLCWWCPKPSVGSQVWCDHPHQLWVTLDHLAPETAHRAFKNRVSSASDPVFFPLHPHPTPHPKADSIPPFPSPTISRPPSSTPGGG